MIYRGLRMLVILLIPGFFNLYGLPAFSENSFGIEQIRNFIFKANSLVDIVSKSDTGVSHRVIGRHGGVEVIECTGKYSTFQKVKELMGDYFSDAMIEVELHRRYLTNMKGKIGGIAASGEGFFVITNDSKFKLITDEPAKKVVEIVMFDDSGEEKKIKYTLERMDEKWQITDEGHNYNNYQPEIIVYLLDWDLIQSSSQLKGYPPGLAFDQKKETAWVEGAQGDGSGEWIQVQWNLDQAVSGMEIINGYAKSREIYQANNRVKKIKVEFSNGVSVEQDLKDNSMDRLQISKFGEVYQTKSVKITILEVYKGIKYQDTCISELRIF